MGILYDFREHGARHGHTVQDRFLAATIADAFRRAPGHGNGAAVPHPAVAALPLVPCNADPVPGWLVTRLTEDRFRLSHDAVGLHDDEVSVRVLGGLLRVEADHDGYAPAALNCLFLLLEPLRLVGYQVAGGRLYIDLQRDHATPCRAEIPPQLGEATAVALAA